MAMGRLISRWRRWSQLTRGLSTAARKRAMTNQLKKVLTCHRRKSAPSTTNAVSKAAATVRTTCEVGAPAHPGSLLGPDALGWAAAVSGFARGFACESSCGTFPPSLVVGALTAALLASPSLWYARVARLRPPRPVSPRVSPYPNFRERRKAEVRLRRIALP